MPRLSMFSISSRGSTRPPRSDVSEVSEMTDHGVGGSRLQWWRRRQEQRVEHRDSIVSGPKTPNTPHAHFDSILVQNDPELPQLSAQARPGSAHFEYYASDPPPFTSRPATRAGPTAGAGVRFAQPGSDDGANHDVERATRRRWSLRSMSTPRPGAKPKWYQKESWVGIRRQLISLFCSGIILSVILAIYLGLTLSNALPKNQAAFQVLLILVLLITGMFFCHSLVRLCIVLTQPHRHRNDSLPFDFLGSSQPTQPVRVRTDPMASPTDSPKLPPPAYGLWRYSVRVDPSQFYWVRNENGDMVDSRTQERPTTNGGTMVPRPPSYVSDDGVSYVVAPGGQPHSPAAWDDRLPPHPSEAGRL